MDNKQLINSLSKRIGLDYKITADAVNSVVEVISQYLVEGDSVVIPGFGTFNTQKTDEEVITDLSTGKRLLLPPAIGVDFTPANSLINKLKK